MSLPCTDENEFIFGDSEHAASVSFRLPELQRVIQAYGTKNGARFAGAPRILNIRISNIANNKSNVKDTNTIFNFVVIFIRKNR
jgi:hypothetical protein